MRHLSRLAVATAVLGGGLLLAGPAAAQEVDCDEYPELAECVIEGDVQEPAQGEADEEDEAEGSTISGSSGGAASLPFTGGEVTLIALAGTAAVGGGVALTAAGRKRKTV